MICQHWHDLRSESTPKRIKKHDHQPVKDLAANIFKALPEPVQRVLNPNGPQQHFIAISADPLWNDFPWELLRFGEGEQDYLGLHHALPRIGGILNKDLAKSRAQPLRGNGKIALFSPHDTQGPALSGVSEELATITQHIKNRGGEIIADAQGTDATLNQLNHQLTLKPDLLYFSGHGTLAFGEELLVVHRDPCDDEAISPISHFGKVQLAQLSDAQHEQLMPQHPVIVLNSCLTGNTRQAGGAREDLVAALISQGAAAIIATALQMSNRVGKAFGELLFDAAIADSTCLGDVIVTVRQHLASNICNDITSAYWGDWAMLHLHGNAYTTLPLTL